MVLFVLRKMAANKWMVASLLIGVILAVAMVTTIPIYSRGILTRLLLRDLQLYQERSGGYSGVVEIGGFFNLDPEVSPRLSGYDELSAQVHREVDRGIPTALLSEARTIRQSFLRVVPVDARETDPAPTSLVTRSGVMDRLTPAVGRMPVAAPEPGTGPVEAVISRQTAAGGRLAYGRTYDVFASRQNEPIPIRVRVVGVVDMADVSDLYWTFPIRDLSDSLIVHEADLRSVIEEYAPGRNIEVEWLYTYDYQALSSEQASPIVDFVEEYTRLARRAGLSVRVQAIRIFEQYMLREQALTMTLWVLQVPLLLMLAFYLFMVSQVLIDHERNEIALLKSRGANVLQVFLTYVILGGLLSLAGVIAGPFLGLLICQILGASSGFLEFVQRRALQLEITGRTYVYAFGAATVALLTILIPALQASRTTIVHHKQRKGTAGGRPIWKLLFLDVVMLGVAIYGLYRYETRAQIVALSGIAATELALDPILLFVSTLFVVGMGLLFLRVYPLFVRLLYRAGARRWPPSLFAALIQVGRGSGKDQFLMLFLILSISIGVYNADAARTLNQNVEERLRYNAGADIVLREDWRQVDSGTGFTVAQDGGGPAGPTGAAPSDSSVAARYVEPPFRRFLELPGVNRATPVFYEQDASGRLLGGGSFGSVALFGIVPHEFGEVAWFRDDLTPSHWYNYLNLLAASPAAALISSSLASDAELNPGDPIYLTWEDQPATLYYVYGIVDYWPGYNPFAGRTGRGTRHLAVVNLNYLQANSALEPYEVWLETDPSIESADLYAGLAAAGIEPVVFTDTGQDLIRERNDPMLQGTNGTLSLGFLVSLGVCFVGFLLYWTFSIRERTLQFGLFRAMGMGRSAIVLTLGMEQLLISGAAVAAGFGIGRLASRLFVPLLQLVENAEEMVPPIRVISNSLDQVRIVGFVVVMLTLGFLILSVFLFRINIHQAVKLGEE